MTSAALRAALLVVITVGVFTWPDTPRWLFAIACGFAVIAALGAALRGGR
jgi:hypothetical protein